MLQKISIQILLFVVFMGLGIDVQADPIGSNVVINGQRLSIQQLQALQFKLGMRVMPGNYLANPQNGCWFNMSTGQRGCLGRSQSNFSRFGSGSRNANGQWNHWSNAAGGAVGGDGNGCIYTSFGWSNC